MKSRLFYLKVELEDKLRSIDKELGDDIILILRAEQSRAEQSRARLSWLDVLKGIGIILVVIGHIYSNQTIFNWLYSFHMPLFFLQQDGV